MMREKAIVPGKYRHYKGKLYEVLYIARHSETEEKMVVYKQLYGNYDIWVRPLKMFTENIEKDGLIVPRFSRSKD